MATQLQKYDGKNIYNNKVYLNFQKKTVKFEPIKTKQRTKKNIKKEFIKQHQAIGLLIGIITGYILAIILAILKQIMIVSNEIIIMILSIHIIGIGIATIKITNTATKTLNTKNFPKRNAEIRELTNKITLRKKKKYEINPETIINKQWIIPKFSNVKLEYKATEEYAKYLKTIKIINQYKRKDYPFIAIIEWTKTPKKGKMEVEYI